MPEFRIDGDKLVETVEEMMTSWLVLFVAIQKMKQDIDSIRGQLHMKRQTEDEAKAEAMKERAAAGPTN